MLKMNRLGEEFDETSADGRTCKVENCSHLQGSYLRFHHCPSHPSPYPQSSSLLPSLSSIFLNPYFAITLTTIFSAQTLVVLDRNKMTNIVLHHHHHHHQCPHLLLLPLPLLSKPWWCSTGKRSSQMVDDQQNVDPVFVSAYGLRISTSLGFDPPSF